MTARPDAGAGARTAPPGIERLPMPARHGHASPLAFWPAAGETGAAPGEARAAPGAAAASTTTPAPAALVLPALGVPAGAYRRLAEALARLGTPTGVAEWRGGGASPVRAARGIDWGYLDLLQHEVLGGMAALRERLRERQDERLHERLNERPVIVIGHSLGGHLGLMARAMAAPGLAGVLTVASGTPTARFFPLRLRLLVRAVLATHRMSGPLLGYFPGHRIGFGGRQARTLMDEWALLARLGRFEIGGRNLVEPQSEAARRIPVRSLSLPHDTYAPRAATVHLLQLAGLGEDRIEDFDGPGPLGHFDWLKEPQALAARMHGLITPWA